MKLTENNNIEDLVKLTENNNIEDLVKLTEEQIRYLIKHRDLILLIKQISESPRDLLRKLRKAKEKEDD